MALVCNIDQRGRALRYRLGSVLVALGVGITLVATRLVDGALPWIVGGVCVAVGAFAWFEANRGWCAARALGIKTKI